MTNKNNCIACGKPLKYTEQSRQMICLYCGQASSSNACCEDGHYICDQCHSAPAMEIIMSYCKNSQSSNPAEMASELMKHPSIKMHGPEHHFLVPAVLLTAYYNQSGEKHLLADKLIEAGNRSRNVLGGFCGFYGACGAGIGTGIFMSLITEATPLSIDSWRLSNMMTAKSLGEIAENGGPRCCKRDSFIAIEEAINYLEDNFGIELERIIEHRCDFSPMNKQCKNEQCRYFKC